MYKSKRDGRIKELKEIANAERIASIYLKRLNQMEAQEMALKLERSSSEKLELAEDLKIRSRLDALSVYPMKMIKTVRKGEDKTYSYWYASWRSGKKVKNAYLGSTNRISHEEALEKARKLKANDLDIDL